MGGWVSILGGDLTSKASISVCLTSCVGGGCLPECHGVFVGVLSQNGTKPTVEDEEWSVDTSEAAVKQRMEDLSSQATNLALTSDLEKSSQDRVNMLFGFVKVSV